MSYWDRTITIAVRDTSEPCLVSPYGGTSLISLSTINPFHNGWQLGFFFHTTMCDEHPILDVKFDETEHQCSVDDLDEETLKEIEFLKDTAKRNKEREENDVKR